MSNHKTPLTDLEAAGLRAHGLGHYIGKPSQLADVFRQGVAWALEKSPAPSAAVDAWVPVSERLPEKGVMVLCLVHKMVEDENGDSFDSLTHDLGETYSTEHGEYLSQYGVDGIAAFWQPLPSPPAIASQEVGHG